MKKTLIIFGFGLTLAVAACGGGADKKTSDSTTTTTTTATITKSSSSVTDTAGLALIKKSDCLTCHKMDEKVIGPAYTDVAAKYTASEAVIDTLANKIIKGGSGNWGTVPMTPHADLSMADAQTMVKYILSLKK